MIHIPILHRSRIVCQCHAALEEEIGMQIKQRLRHLYSYFDLKPIIWRHKPPCVWEMTLRWRSRFETQQFKNTNSIHYKDHLNEEELHVWADNAHRHSEIPPNGHCSSVSWFFTYDWSLKKQKILTNLFFFSGFKGESTHGSNGNLLMSWVSPRKMFS